MDDDGGDGIVVEVVDGRKLEIEQSQVSVIHQPCPMAEMTAPQPLAGALRSSRLFKSGVW